MIKKIISIFCMFLILSSTFVSAQIGGSVEETGESIIINVDKIEPTIVPTNVLEEQNVPVYVYLKGTTIDALALGDSEEPILYGIPEIERVAISGWESSGNLISNIKYIKPRDKQNVVSNFGRFFDMGYLIVELRQINSEEDLEGLEDTVFSEDIGGVEVSAGGGEIVKAAVNLDVRFDLENSFGGFGSQDLRLVEEIDEDEWRSSIDKASFWARNGYVRADRITDDSITLSVYDGSLRKLRTFTLDEEEESSPVRLREFGDNQNNFFRVKLNDISIPRDTTEVDIDGDIYELVEGQRLYPGSDWKVEDIKNDVIVESRNGGKSRVDEIVIKNSDGERKRLRIIYFSGGSKIDTTTGAYNTELDYVSNPFLAKTEEISQNLGIDPNHLLSVMHFETGGRFDPAVTNSDSGAVGLIQFLPSTAEGLGTSTEKLKGMSAVEQLDYVEKYYDQYNDRIREGNLEDTYMAVLYPVAIGKESSYVLFRRGSTEYTQNSGLDVNNDGSITVGEATSKVRDVGFVTSPESELQSEDVCDGVEFDDVSAKDQSTQRIYCKAVQELEEAIAQGLEGEDLSNAYYKLGQSYEGLGTDNLYYKQKAIDAYSSVDGSYIGRAETRIEDLEKQILELADVSNADAYLEVEDINIELRSVNSLRVREQATVTLSVNNEQKNLRIGEIVVNGEDERNGGFSWVVDSIASNRVTVKQLFENSAIRGRTESIRLEDVKNLQTSGNDSVVLQILEIDTKKQAYITVLPGSGRAISRSVVDLNIPIERRSIQLSTEKIDDQIEKTRDLIEKLDDIIDRVDSTVDTLRVICVSVFGLLTLKNFALGTGSLEAKNLILKGVDGKSGFGQYCISNSGAGKRYSNYDECVIANQQFIQKRVGEVEVDINQANTYVENEYESDYGDYRLSPGEDILISTEDVRELELLKAQIEDSERNLNTLDSGSVEYQMEVEYNRKLDERFEAKNNYIEGRKKNIVEAKTFSTRVVGSASTENEEQLARDAFEAKLNELDFSLDSTVVSIGEYKGAKRVVWVNGEAYDPDGNVVDLNEVKIDGKIVVTEDGKTIYESGGDYYYSATGDYFGERVRTTYARKNTAEYYQNGRPFCVPTSNGNYVRVLEYYEDGTPKTVDERNVGPNGILCDNDDVIINSDSVVKLNPRKEQELKQAATRAGFCRPGDQTTNFFCSHARARAVEAINELHCTDVMTIRDCKILFNVCDPVMCPTSRFNFGGKWHVDNVPETGIIGSLVLGLPNSAIPIPGVAEGGGSNIVPPVCLPGIQSGLEGFRSVLQGYEQCLQTSKTTGENVGICDKVKSVFICENLWREAVSLTGTTGALDIIEGKFFGGNEGGGEYSPSSFNKKINQVSDSAKFFLTEYSTASLSAYEARSLGEAGQEVCKNIYAGKAPGLGKLINQVTAPESPPQFTAFFDEYPWAGSAGTTSSSVGESAFSSIDEQSRYSVFYHIYAGRANDIRYSVYLKDSLGNVAYVTERAGGRGRGFVLAGDFVSKNIDFIGRSGYNEICVEINGREDCGFGRASTSLAVDYITDRQVKSDLNKDINTKEQCVPEDVTGPIIGGPTSFGDATGGLVRVCSHANPGEGGVEGNWEVVGSCGEDEEGINLGSCWIDTTTIRLNNKQIIDENVENIVKKVTERTISDLSQENLEKSYIANSKLLRGHIDDGIVSRDWEYINNNVLNSEDGLRDISVLSAEFGTLAQLRIGEAYLQLAEEKKRTDVRVVPDIVVPSTPTSEPETESEKDSEITGAFTLCLENSVYYCVNEGEGCYSGIAKEGELTQEECKEEREGKLTDPAVCDGNSFGTVLTFWERRNICHKRTLEVNSCYYDTSSAPDSCISCNDQTVQRAQCSVYKDKDECEKWDPCVFNCEWNEGIGQCLSKQAADEGSEINVVKDPLSVIGSEDAEASDLFVLKYSNGVLVIQSDSIEGNYYIRNDPTNGLYPIYEDKFIDSGVGYVNPSGRFDVESGVDDELVLERMLVPPETIASLFSERRDGIYTLSSKASENSDELVAPDTSTIESYGESVLDDLTIDSFGSYFKYAILDSSGNGPVLFYRYENGWEWSPDRLNWMPVSTNVVLGGEFDNQSPVQEQREFINYLLTVNPSVEFVQQKMFEGIINKLEETDTEGVYVYDTPISGNDLLYYRNENGWEWSPDKVNWMPVSTRVVSGGDFDGEIPIQEQVDVINTLKFFQS